MSEQMINTIIQWAIAPVILALVKWYLDRKGMSLQELFSMVRDTNDKIDNLKVASDTQGVATRNLLRYRLLKTMGYAKSQGYTTDNELQEVCNLYESYKALGGNSVVDIRFEEYKKLEIRVSSGHDIR